MCTIILATRVFPEAPLALGANREERYDRPSAPPGQLDEDPVVYGPRDLEAGGTWIAINEHGVLVAVTNRSGGPPGERSRGWLVRDTARRPDVDSAIRVAEDALESGQYTGCNLLVADPSTAVVFTWDGTLERRDLPPGFHVIVNEGVNGDVAKSAVVRSRIAAAAPGSVSAWQARVKVLLEDHGIGTCLHGGEGGTRSSSLVARSPTGAVRWSYADGPPCETTYQRWRKSEL